MFDGSEKVYVHPYEKDKIGFRLVKHPYEWKLTLDAENPVGYEYKVSFELWGIHDEIKCFDSQGKEIGFKLITEIYGNRYDVEEFKEVTFGSNMSKSLQKYENGKYALYRNFSRLLNVFVISESPIAKMQSLQINEEIYYLDDPSGEYSVPTPRFSP